MSTVTDIRYSKQDAEEIGCGWYAVRRDTRHGPANRLPDVSQLFETREEAEAWARREDDVVRKSSRPVIDCPMPESEFRPVVYVPQPRFIPGIAANQIQPPPAAPGRRVAT